MIVVPDGRGQLSEGLLVEASVVARLFRLRLLAVDASLAIVPARVMGRTGLDDPLTRIPPRARAIGPGLVAAERCLSEGAASLARSRH